MKSFFNNLGIVLFVLGAMALAMSFFDMVPHRIRWIYNWGDLVAYSIIGSLIVFGGLMFFFIKDKKS